MPVVPFLGRWRAARAQRSSATSGAAIARVHEPGATTWAMHSGDAVARVLRRTWPRHASRTAVLVGSDLDARTIAALRELRARLGVMAIDRADGACHAPAGAVIDAALGAQRLTGSDLVRADGILVIGDAPFGDRRASADLLTARALEIPMLTLTDGTLSLGPVVSSAPHDPATFVQAVLRRLLADNAVDRAFIAANTVGFGEFLEDLESDSGVTRVPDDHVAPVAHFVAASARLAVVWQPSTSTEDALLARSLVGLLLARGSVGSPGTGLYVVGPVGAPHPLDCCTTRGSGRNTGIGGTPQPLGVVQRAQLGDIETLITVGADPFAGVDRLLEREALEGVRAHIHVGTAGSDAIPVRNTRVIVLPGDCATRLRDVVRAVLSQEPRDALPPQVQTATQADAERYAFVARAVGRHVV